MARASSLRRFTIGRAADCDVVLADESVSRHHAELVVTKTGELFLSDCQSTHGTEVLDQGRRRPLSQEIVAPDATIKFGEVTITVVELMDALRARHPEIAFPRGTAPGAAPEGHNPWSEGSRLVRCACGAIKPKHQHCPECGE